MRYVYIYLCIDQTKQLATCPESTHTDRVAKVAVPTLVVWGRVLAGWRGWGNNSGSQQYELHATTAIPVNYMCAQVQSSMQNERSESVFSVQF